MSTFQAAANVFQSPYQLVVRMFGRIFSNCSPHYIVHLTLPQTCCATLVLSVFLLQEHQHCIIMFQMFNLYLDCPLLTNPSLVPKSL